MRLSDVRKHGNTSGSTAVQENPNQSEQGTILNATAYTYPINALFQGKPVTLLATGDIVGMSPACQFVDEDGKIDWASIDDFVVDDRHVVPQSLEQRQKLLSSFQRSRR